jgi:hypothetical protein
VNPGVTIFRSEADAAATYRELIDAYANCRAEFLPEIERQFRTGFEENSDPAGLEGLQVSFDERPFSTDAQEPASYRARLQGTAAGTPFDITIDFVIMQEARLIGGFVYFAFTGPVDEDEQRDIAGITVVKLRTANDQLPD